MIPVSNEYMNKIYDDETKTYCTASFGLYDLNAKSQATVTASSEYLRSGKSTEFNSSLAPTIWTGTNPPWRYSSTNYFGSWEANASHALDSYPASNAVDDSMATYYRVGMSDQVLRTYTLSSPIAIQPKTISIRHKYGDGSNIKITLLGYTTEWVTLGDIFCSNAITTQTFNYNGTQKFTKFRLDIQNQSTLSTTRFYYLYDFKITSGIIARNAPDNTIDGVIGDTTSIWESAETSNASGTFTTNPFIEYEWQENHSSSGLQLYFNTVVKSATITYYNGSTVLDTYTISGDDYSYNIENEVSNYTKIKIEFIEIGANSRVEMQEINFGVEYLFNEEIISISVEECLDNKMQELASNKATIRLNDLDKKFNQYSPNSLFQYIQEGQRVQIVNHAIINGNIESVPLGVFYLSSWKNDTEFTISFEANDILYRLAGRDFIRSPFINYNSTSSFISATTLLTNMFNDFNTTYGEVVQYSIDSALDNVMFGGYLSVTDYRTALQQICIACQAVAYSNRDGKIAVKKLNNSSIVEVLDYGKKTFSTTETLERYGAVIVNACTGIGRSAYDETIFSESVDGDLTVIFTEPMDRVTVTGADSYEIYANCVDVHTNSSSTVTITGSPLAIQKKTPVKETNYSSSNVTNLELELQDINIITSSTQAQSVATWLLAELQKSLKMSFRWLANPSIELGDTIGVQVSDDTFMTAQILKNQFSFNGALSETSECILIGNITLQTWNGLTETYWSDFGNKTWKEIGYVATNN